MEKRTMIVVVMTNDDGTVKFDAKFLAAGTLTISGLVTPFSFLAKNNNEQTW